MCQHILYFCIFCKCLHRCIIRRSKCFSFPLEEQMKVFGPELIISVMIISQQQLTAIHEFHITFQNTRFSKRLNSTNKLVFDFTLPKHREDFSIYPHVKSSLALSCSVDSFALGFQQSLPNFFSFCLSLFVSEIKARADLDFLKVSWDCVCKSFCTFQARFVISVPPTSKKPIWFFLLLMYSRCISVRVFHF